MDTPNSIPSRRLIRKPKNRAKPKPVSTLNYKALFSSLYTIVDGCSSTFTSNEFFTSLVKSLAKALKVRYAFVTECLELDSKIVRTLGVWGGDDYLENFEYFLQGTPCEHVMGKAKYFCNKGLQKLFPDDQILVDLNVESYLGVPFFNQYQDPLGHIAIMHTRPLRHAEEAEKILNLFADLSASAVLRRRDEMWKNGQNLVLEKLSTKRPLPEILKTLSQVAEEQFPHMRCQVFIKKLPLHPEKKVRRKKTDWNAFKDKIAVPNSNKPALSEAPLLMISNTFKHDLKDRFGKINRFRNLKTAWVKPLLSPKGEVLGNLSIYRNEFRLPSRTETRLIQSFSWLAGLAILTKQSDSRLEAYSRKLELNNQDLRDFVNIAAHDLNEPLRKILFYGNFLKSQLGSPEPKAENYLDKIQTSTHRLIQLIEDLLTLTRIDNEPKPKTKTDLLEVVEKVLEELELVIQETGAQIIVKQLPVVKAEALEMYLLFFNLIGNAVKFRKKDVPPVVTLDTRYANDGSIEIRVEDNGIGIDKKYFDKIIKPFHRLHPRESYKGTGIGLSICDKIVKHHNGVLKIDSEPGKGSTFSIILFD